MLHTDLLLRRGMLSYLFSGREPADLPKGRAVEGTLLASKLGFPEGPVVMPDGAIVLCDGNTGELLRWKDGAMGTFADTGGSPWGAVLGSDGAIYVTQGGNVPGSGDQSAVAGHPAGERGRLGRAARVEHRRPRRWPGRTTSRSVPTAGCGSPTRAPSRTTATSPPTARPAGSSCSARRAAASS